MAVTVGLRRWLASLAQRDIAQRLVRTEAVVVGAIGLHDVVEMLQTDADEMIQTLSF